MDGWCWPPYSVFFIDFWWCEGSGASFECLRMRHRSRRKCAPMNAGDLGSRLAVCACAYDPNHVTAQDKRLGPNCACVALVTRFYAVRSLKLCELWGSNTCVRVLFPMGSREHSCPNMGICDVNEVTWAQCSILIGRTLFVLRSDWLGPFVATITTFTTHVQTC